MSARRPHAYIEGFCALFDTYGWEISETTGTEPSKSKKGYTYFCAGPIAHGGAVQVNFTIDDEGNVTSDVPVEIVALAKGARR